MEDSTMNEILLINGPNLARLGARKPEVYGSVSLSSLTTKLQNHCENSGYKIVPFQSNHEGNIIDFVENNHEAVGMIINPGALMVSGWSLRDCLEDFPKYKIEVHISNIWTRETFRHVSILSPVVNGVIAGLGIRGYTLALNCILSHKSEVS